jgi:hypothetical protein
MAGYSQCIRVRVDCPNMIIMRIQTLGDTYLDNVLVE